MIQRIQTLWLLLAACCGALTYKFSFFSGNKLAKNGMHEFHKLVASSNFLLLIFTAVLVAGCLILIFLYKNRKMQGWLTLCAIALSVINLVIYFDQANKFIPKEGTYDLSAILSLIIPILLVLALRGIWKDEKLVKSLDRLR